MALTSPAVTLAVEAMFGNIKPTLNALKKLGITDFSAEKPGFDIKPGATIKVPVSSINAAAAFDADSNNYLTGGNTDWCIGRINYLPLHIKDGEYLFSRSKG